MFVIIILSSSLSDHRTLQLVFMLYPKDWAYKRLKKPGINVTLDFPSMSQYHHCGENLVILQYKSNRFHSMSIKTLLYSYKSVFPLFPYCSWRTVIYEGTGSEYGIDIDYFATSCKPIQKWENERQLQWV